MNNFYKDFVSRTNSPKSILIKNDPFRSTKASFKDNLTIKPQLNQKDEDFK